MELSVIIVNYNVRRYLLQCLNSLAQALQPFGAEAEVLVVDNASADSSGDAVGEWMRSCSDFPLKWIENHENVGFGRANNQAVRRASGRFLLFLNPDTVVSAEALAACREKMQADPLCGAIGVRMLDAHGRFLPESKRGFPDPLTSFCKLTRLYRLFPRVRGMNRYYLSWLSELEEQRVEVLAGAFMYVRRTEELEREGYFDERFFMYGEDIDLSYRVGLHHSRYCAYLPSPILHYKGESTDGASFRYIRVFYGAMELFQKKYYGRFASSLFLWAGIRLATAVAAVKWFLSTACLEGKRRRKREKVPCLFCVFTSRNLPLGPLFPFRAGDEVHVFPAMELDYAQVAGNILPLVRGKGSRRVHIVLDMNVYSYGAALEFLGGRAWEQLRGNLFAAGSSLQIAFLSGRTPMVVVADNR